MDGILLEVAMIGDRRLALDGMCQFQTSTVTSFEALAASNAPTLRSGK
jgi:hypothetical protein